MLEKNEGIRQEGNRTAERGSGSLGRVGRQNASPKSANDDENGFTLPSL